MINIKIILKIKSFNQRLFGIILADYIYLILKVMGIRIDRAKDTIIVFIILYFPLYGIVLYNITGRHIQYFRIIIINRIYRIW